MTLPRLHAGFTLLELLVVLAILGVLLSLGALALLNLRNPAQEGQSLTAATLRTVRARAVKTSGAYRLQLTRDRRGMQVASAMACDSATWVRQPQYDVVLPDRALYQNSAWEVCYTPRGSLDSAAAPAALTITDHQQHLRGLQVYLGGAVQETP
ncbi:prepilin-type N-terminal cleavage/methylation domain-containing protein [Deinococcus sp. S9]|uniref:prepilin-type N-terminal cleavage/methylation domain-containing protein n=1 Tax=Deinococcus sp. S9 TaxID=2545754 RepID=UPI0019818DE9|nr:prepilin-type N-terminal cleavage/methylation domain-containing protein [Deinococcus sp. S9]